MIPYTLPEEKETLLFYAKLLDDKKAEEIIKQDQLRNREEAIHLANFFWKMVEASNIEDKKSGTSSEYIMEKIIITLMAFFQASGYNDEWEYVADKN